MRVILSVLLIWVPLGLEGAVVVHDEGVDGDLSGDFMVPDLLPVSVGGNSIIGQVGRNGNTGGSFGSDGDYWTFIIPDGYSVVALTIDGYGFPSGDPNLSLLAYTLGSGFTGQGASSIDGHVLFNADSGDVLTELAGGPLEAGTYSFWVQEESLPVRMSYEMTFHVVPEPGVVGLLVAGVLGSVLGRRRTDLR